MKIEFRNNKDLFAGLLFLVNGLIAVIIAQDYPMGKTFQMGPGYFPIMLGWILCTFGLYIMIRGLIKGEKIRGVWGIRPLFFITLSILAFGFLLERLGMVPALLGMFFICAFGGHEFKFKEVSVLAVLMTAVAWAIFIYGLGQPLRLFWWS